ncbi:Polyketide synthase enoylreductase [Penicillium cinerascens]|uniref:Polyketide synthase enoylreductase n=1 Tax=Penicillium cinerascens TaxID=70096 RepID=A0A9W9MIX2_9EURO|nr:Polyketide synthase enoylreductase [Penicillium cinerascens]KAJ5202122.1 Polyketide synthase enoylreductase [Penicillium cinerascens]
MPMEFAPFSEALDTWHRRRYWSAAGLESSVCTAAYTARRGGPVMGTGVGKTIMNNQPFMHISLAERSGQSGINLRFINRYRDTWPPAIQCLSGGILDLMKLFSYVFPLEKAEDALHLCADARNGSIKVLVVDEQEDSL